MCRVLLGGVSTGFRRNSWLIVLFLSQTIVTTKGFGWAWHMAWARGGLFVCGNNISKTVQASPDIDAAFSTIIRRCSFPGRFLGTCCLFACAVRHKMTIRWEDGTETIRSSTAREGLLDNETYHPPRWILRWPRTTEPARPREAPLRNRVGETGKGRPGKSASIGSTRSAAISSPLSTSTAEGTPAAERPAYLSRK